NRGWRIHRIWSTRWWYHRAEEIEKLLHALVTIDSRTALAQESVPISDPQRLQVAVSTMQTIGEAVSTQHQVGPSYASTDLLRNGPDPLMTLGQLRDKLAKSGEFRGSWERFLRHVKLATGMGLTRDMTLAEAQRIVLNRRVLT